MKTVLITISIFILSGCSILRPLKTASTDLREAELKGMVKAIYETDQEISEKTGEREYTRYTIVRYNTAGNLVSEELFQVPGGKGISKTEYVYDKTDRIMTESTCFDLIARTYLRYEYEYDKNGRLTRQISESGTQLFEYKYDRKGYLITERISMVKEGEASRFTIKDSYGRDGRLTKSREGDMRKKYVYNAAGKLSEVRYGDGTTDRYDQTGNLIGITQHVIFNLSGLQEKGYNVELTADYRYDDRGNWVSRRIMHKDEPIRITERKIDYYN